jgi:hypothetical protein
MSEAKFCKDCKFCKRSFYDLIFLLGTYEFAMCTRPGPMETRTKHLVTKKLQPYGYCSSERITYKWVDTCGAIPKYFEAKK